MKINITPALSFSDVIMVPKYSSISSRTSVDLTSKLTEKISIGCPILSTNMATVTEADMMIAMWKLGGAGILHRFLPEKRLLEETTVAKEAGVSPLIISIGVKVEDYR